MKFPGSRPTFHLSSVRGELSVAQESVIAIVDDEEDVRQSTCNLLRSYGIGVAAFDSAETFLTHADLSEISGLITDVNMPGMGGLALLDALRQRRTSFPVIVISALDAEPTRELALERGAQAYLPKPVDPDDLMGLVNAWGLSA